MSAKVLPVTNFNRKYGKGSSFKEFHSRSSSLKTDSDSSSDSELKCSPPVRTQTLASHSDSSTDSELRCSQPLTHPTLPLQLSSNVLGSTENCQSTSVQPLTLEQYPKIMSLSLSNYQCLQDSVTSKLDSSSFNKFREVSADLSKLRKRYRVRQPVYRLEMNGEETVYLTGHKTKRTVPFKLCEANKYELLRVEPEYVNVFQHIFGSKTNRLMKKDFSAESTHEWKNLCRFVMSQFGLSLDSDGNVVETSKVPDYAVVIKFGANTFPFKLAENILQRWQSENTTLMELDVSFREKLTDKQETVETLLSGLKFEKVWSPSSHDESLFCNSDLYEYEEWLRKKHFLTLQDDPVLLYAAVSSNRENLALVAVADHAVKLSFCDVENNGALLELRDRFMEVTKSDDLECVSERKLNKMLERLSK